MQEGEGQQCRLLDLNNATGEEIIRIWKHAKKNKRITAKKNPFTDYLAYIMEKKVNK